MAACYGFGGFTKLFRFCLRLLAMDVSLDGCANLSLELLRGLLNFDDERHACVRLNARYSKHLSILTLLKELVDLVFIGYNLADQGVLDDAYLAFIEGQLRK